MALLFPPKRLHVTVSIGVAELDDSCTSIDALVNHADRAMYLAKNDGTESSQNMEPGKSHCRT